MSALSFCWRSRWYTLLTDLGYPRRLHGQSPIVWRATIYLRQRTCSLLLFNRLHPFLASPGLHRRRPQGMEVWGYLGGLPLLDSDEDNSQTWKRLWLSSLNHLGQASTYYGRSVILFLCDAKGTLRSQTLWCYFIRSARSRQGTSWSCPEACFGSPSSFWGTTGPDSLAVFTALRRAWHWVDHTRQVQAQSRLLSWERGH